MKKVNIGIIGCGLMGMDIVRRLLRCSDQLNISALYDPNENSIQQAKSELNSSVIVCSDYIDIMKMSDVDWVMIASWNKFHCEQVVAAFEAGKHVFCQKPLAINLEELIQIQNAWKKNKKLFNLGFTLRYSPHYRKIKEIISDGYIGQIISMEFNETLEFNHGGYIMGDWRRLQCNAGTHLLEKTCHDIDIANWMTNSLAKRVASFGGLNYFKPENAHHINRIGKNKDGKPAYSAMGGPINLNPFHSDKDIVDNQVAILEYNNGIRATFHTNLNSAIPERRMYIVGTEGAIRADVLSGEIFVKRIGFETKCENLSTGAKGIHGDGDEFLVRELTESMLNKKTPSVSMKEGVTSAATCFGIDDAMENNTIVNMDPYWKMVGVDNNGEYNSK